MKRFGHREAGISYLDRPGAYAIMADADGRIATVSTPSGFHLPAGAFEEVPAKSEIDHVTHWLTPTEVDGRLLCASPRWALSCWRDSLG
ncbi:MAG: hypothetical protein RIC56_11795 [Pseudomonadales bacterium]